LRSGSVHHAYLFEGPEGVGQEDVAVAFAQALLCSVRPNEGCGTCAVCGRIARRNHPDVTVVMPEDELVARGLAGRSDFAATPSRDIRVEQIRGLQDRLSRRALEGKRKLALLIDAERMNPQAQNAFLKTLEEPPAETVLLLLASFSDRLLPTIRSRCARVAFAPLPAALVALDAEGLARRKELIEAFEALPSTGASGLLAFAETFGGSREEAEDALRVLALWLRDVAVVRAGGVPLSSDLEELAQQAAARTSGVALHRRTLLLEQAVEAIATRNAAPRLQMERMLVEMGAP
jgi:DNA polymerase-3 subunit delta'